VSNVMGSGSASLAGRWRRGGRCVPRRSPGKAVITSTEDLSPDFHTANSEAMKRVPRMSSKARIGVETPTTVRAFLQTMSIITGSACQRGQDR